MSGFSRPRNRYLIQLCGVSGRPSLLLHPPPVFILLRAPGTGDVHRGLAVPFVDLVHGFHQLAVVALGRRRIKQQVTLHLGGGRGQVQQHHPGLGQLVAGLVNPPDAGHGRADQHRGVRGWRVQLDGDRLVEARAWPKRRAVCKDQQGAGTLVAVAQLLGGPGGELAHGLDQRGQDVDGVAEAARAGDLLFGRRGLLQADAADALQLAHRALQQHAPFVPGLGGRHPGHIQGGEDALLGKPRRNAPADPPHIARRRAAQQVDALLP